MCCNIRLTSKSVAVKTGDFTTVKACKNLGPRKYGAYNRRTSKTVGAIEGVCCIPFQDKLGIVFPKFEDPSINDGSHRGELILADPFIMANFQSEKSSVLTPDLSRS